MRRKILLLTLVGAVCGATIWKFLASPAPSKCSQYQRPVGEGTALICREQTLNDAMLHLYIREGQKADTPLIHLGEVSNSEKATYFAGCYWSKDGSLFVTTIASNRPNAPVEDRTFQAGYDFLKRQPIHPSQFNSLLKRRGGAGAILDVTH